MFLQWRWWSQIVADPPGSSIGFIPALIRVPCDSSSWDPREISRARTRLSRAIESAAISISARVWRQEWKGGEISSRRLCRGALESVVRYSCSRRRHAIKPRPHVDIAWRLPPRLPSNYHGTRYANSKQTGVTLPPRATRFSRFSAPAQNSRRVSKLPRDDDTSGDKASRPGTSGIARAPGIQMETAHRRRTYPRCCGIFPARATKWRLMEIELRSNRQYTPWAADISSRNIFSLDAIRSTECSRNFQASLHAES